MNELVVIHGGDAFETYDEYLDDLKNKEVTLDRIRSVGWKQNLGKDLEGLYDVIYPKMPNAQNARFLEWRIYFEKIIPLLKDEIVFVGHSLGGIFLAKYLAEENCPKKIAATFLIAAPYNTPEQHPLVDFTLTSPLDKFVKQAGIITLYHSRDDKVVPFSNAQDYQKALPNATLKVFENRGHFNDEHFPELVVDLKGLFK